jgi:hypothetical protein
MKIMRAVHYNFIWQNIMICLFVWWCLTPLQYFSYIVAVSFLIIFVIHVHVLHLFIIMSWGPLLPWLYGSWIYNYLCNHCLWPLKLWVRTSFMTRYTRCNFHYPHLFCIISFHNKCIQWVYDQLFSWVFITITTILISVKLFRRYVQRVSSMEQ